MSPDLSVVVPTHNRRALLADTLASVLAERAVDLEVIVVVDGGDDGTAEWLATHDDPRVRFLVLAPPRERSAARNAGLAEARAEAVMFLDDDDLVRPGALPHLLRGVAAEGASAAVGTYVTFGATSTPHRQPTTRFPVTRALWPEHLWGWHFTPGAGVWRTRAVRELGGWVEDMSHAEDLELSLRTYGRSVAFVPRTVLDYRVQPRVVDAARHRWEVDHDGAVRRAFVDRLDGRDREHAERLLRARDRYFVGLDAYERADFRAAAAAFTGMLRAAPSLGRSPIVGPWLVGLVAKAASAAAVPPAVHRAVRERRRAARARRHDRGDGS